MPMMSPPAAVARSRPKEAPVGFAILDEIFWQRTALPDQITDTYLSLRARLFQPLRRRTVGSPTLSTSSSGLSPATSTTPGRTIGRPGELGLRNAASRQDPGAFARHILFVIADLVPAARHPTRYGTTGMDRFAQQVSDPGDLWTSKFLQRLREYGPIVRNR